MDITGRCWKKYAFFGIISILLELTVFNCRALISLSGSDRHPEYIKEGNSVYVEGMEAVPNYVYLDVSSYTEKGEQVPVKLTVMLQDEGNSGWYEVPQTTIYPPVEKRKYLSVHTYGAIKGMKILMEADPSADLQVTDVIYDARVPWFISFPRILAVFAILCIAWGLRPRSGIYAWSGKTWQKYLAVAAVLGANSLLFLFLIRSNPAFLNPPWPYHGQYHKLAEALGRGEVSIDAGSAELVNALNLLENPYDAEARMGTVPGADSVWDICYYQGKFYVYFGIVPVILFYLPYYLIFHAAFPTWLGIFITGVGILSGVYFLFALIRRRWFSGIAFAHYLLLSMIAGNSFNLFCVMLHADFYCLPILTALCLTLWGLGLILSAAECWDGQRGFVRLKLMLGGLCLALTAGCRPQFLVASVLAVPLLWPLFWTGRGKRQFWKRLMSLVLPYLVVAAGLMYYNAVRFGSIADFGANYNLTTNDMTRRGVNLSRLPDGIFMYLFQPVSLKVNFPFAEVTAFYTEYLGSTVKDWTYGGAFWIYPVLLSTAALAGVKEELKQKKIYSFTILSMCLAAVVVVADTEMAGILNRYYTDFLWLLVIPAVIVLFQMLEKFQNREGGKWITGFILLAGAWGIFYGLGMAFRGSGLMNDNAHRYYMIESLFW